MAYSTPEKRREYNRRRKEHNREYYREWYKKNGRARADNYAEAIIQWDKDHPEAYSAKRKVYYAVKTGKLIKPKKCSKCGIEVRLSAHHEDYSKPLEVLWLCSSCHKLEHNK